MEDDLIDDGNFNYEIKEVSQNRIDIISQLNNLNLKKWKVTLIFHIIKKLFYITSSVSER